MGAPNLFQLFTVRLMKLRARPLQSVSAKCHKVQHNAGSSSFLSVFATQSCITGLDFLTGCLTKHFEALFETPCLKFVGERKKSGELVLLCSTITTTKNFAFNFSIIINFETGNFLAAEKIGIEIETSNRNALYFDHSVIKIIRK